MRLQNIMRLLNLQGINSCFLIACEELRNKAYTIGENVRDISRITYLKDPIATGYAQGY